MVPATQGVHCVLEVVLQAWEKYVPALQVLQAEHVPALVVVEYDVPATHGVQTAAAETVHAEATYDPAAQTLHAAGAVTPAKQ